MSDVPVLVAAPLPPGLEEGDQLSADGRWLFHQRFQGRILAFPLPGNRASRPVLLATGRTPADLLVTPEALYLSVDGAIHVLDPVTLARRGELPSPPAPASLIALGGGTFVADPDGPGDLLVRTTADTAWREIPDPRGRPPMAVTEDGSRLVTCGHSYGPLTVKVFAVADGETLLEQEVASPAGHCKRVVDAGNGVYHLIGTQGIARFDLGTGAFGPFVHAAVEAGSAVSATDRQVWLHPGGYRANGPPMVYSLAEGAFVARGAPPTWGPVLASADDRRLVYEDAPDHLALADGRRVRSLGPDRATHHRDGPACLRWVDADTVRVVDGQGVLGEWDVTTGTGVLRQLPFWTHTCDTAGGAVVGRGSLWSPTGHFPLPEVDDVVLSPDGLTWAGTAPGDRLWLGDRSARRTLDLPGDAAVLQFSPDARRLAGIARERTSWTVWDLADGTARTFPVPEIGEWAWSADGSRVFLTVDRRTLEAMDPDTGARTVLAEELPWDATVALWMWGLPGGRVVTAHKSGFTLWRPEAGFTVVDKIGDDCGHAPSPDGTRLFSACRDGSLWLHALAP